MAEEIGQSKYIRCSKYKCKCLNCEESISIYFGYTRLEERYKTCKHCREICKINNNIYSENHPDKIKKRANQYYKDHQEEVKEYNKQYRDNNDDKLKEYERARNRIKVHCPNCNVEVDNIYI